MIIQGAEGDALARIEDMERDLCRKHKVGRKLLYPTLRQADFHRTYQDPPEFGRRRHMRLSEAYFSLTSLDSIN
jgi:hypothetical protein